MDNNIFQINGRKQTAPINSKTINDTTASDAIKKSIFHLKREFPAFLFSEKGIFIDASFFTIDSRNIKLKRECIHKKRIINANPIMPSRIIRGNTQTGGFEPEIDSPVWEISPVWETPAGSTC